MTDHGDDVEIRYFISRRDAAILDAACMARGGKHRNDLLIPATHAFLAQIEHESIVVQRVLRGNGTGSDGEGKGP